MTSFGIREIGKSDSWQIADSNPGLPALSCFSTKRDYATTYVWGEVVGPREKQLVAVKFRDVLWPEKPSNQQCGHKMRSRWSAVSMLNLVPAHADILTPQLPLPAPRDFLQLANNQVFRLTQPFHLHSLIHKAHPRPHCADGNTESQRSKLTSQGHKQVSCRSPECKTRTV